MSDQLINVLSEGNGVGDVTTEALQEKDWQEVYAARQTRKILFATLSGIETHTLRENEIECAVVRIGRVKGLIPFDYMEVKDKRQMRNMMGQKLGFLVIGIDEANKMFIGSRSGALEVMQSATWKEIQAKGVGTVVNAEVRYVAPKYALVQIGGIETTLDISEFDYGWVDNLRDKIQAGDNITVKITEFDQEKKELKISRKATQQNPWDYVDQLVSKNCEYTGTVSGVVKFGNFINLAPGIDALTPHMKFETLSKGDLVVVRIREIRPEKEEISASIIKILRKNQVFTL
ncbi:S1 RNA-binding domain-containing protein [Alkalihalobacillus oceani]|uniref:S1 RNA-binding domain-containing protein n=1 Tax=Halalkalibacter oceani TaxID=1653776 RepID=A0A9X2IQG2_9BACI|nr:S1 RNA-binding domain-containing protein [Halalkalibacter oceani]MCM3716270.1 S1 RNA-binding domain-containing protein [Halalkalibacter oceani]